MEIIKVVKPFIKRGWPNTFGNIVYLFFYKLCVSSWRYLCNPSLTLQELEPMTSVPPVFAEGDNKHSASCKITAGCRHRQSHQKRGNGHKKPVPIHPSNSCLRPDLQKSLNAAISLQTGSGTDRNTHSETSLTAIWQHNVSLSRSTDISSAEETILKGNNFLLTKNENVDWIFFPLMVFKSYLLLLILIVFIFVLNTYNFI